jgi:RNA polymerase sigma factor (sigma-70 family)
LLGRYARGESEEAFAELVHRHVALVYSAAMRQVRSPQLAEEVAQSVFMDLARSAAELKPNTILAAWLYQVTRRTAIDSVRRESRRQVRERLAQDMTAMETATADWPQIESLLDDAMNILEENERAAILLRYFENKSLREVGQTLGTSEDAAQKRVSRAVDRLRAYFAQHGVGVGAGALALMLSASAVSAAPTGLAATISAAVVVAGAVTKTAGTGFIAKTITMTALQKTGIAAGLFLATGVGIYEAARAVRLQHELAASQQQQAPLSEELRAANQARDEATNLLAGLRAENEQLRRDRAEVPKLRGEVSRLNQAAKALASSNSAGNGDPALAEAVSWKSRVDKLKARLDQTSGARIPELQFITEQDWLDAAKGELNTDQDYRRALSSLRHAGENKFVVDLQPALKKFMDANNGQFPTDLVQLEPYFKAPVDEAVLQRYEIIPAENLPNLGMGGNHIITQKAAVDPEFDSRWGIGPNGFGTTGSSSWTGEDIALVSAVKTLAPILKAYIAEHGGNEPTDPSQIQPYVSTPAQMTALQTLIKQAKAKEKRQ